MLLCTAIFVFTAPGRITYPDDEIVFQTTQSLVDRHSLAITGIPKRTGERPDRPNGTFGWGPGDPDRHAEGIRYGFFGHGLSVVATPMYALAKATAPKVPPKWRYAIRSDLFTFHTRGLEADWTRMIVSLTNCLLTPLGAVLLGLWLLELGHRRQTAVGLALIYALATTAWPYSGTLLSEPLTVAVLLGAGLGIARFRRTGSRWALWIAAALTGLSVHVHLLNLLAIPCLLGYAIAPFVDLDARTFTGDRKTWAIALALGAAGLALLGFGQWWRFGSPFETGRFDSYGHWVWPWEGIVTMAIAPGRSLLIYSPPVIAGLVAWPALRRRDPQLAWFLVALVATRWVFVACRSDWHGGWGIGPRYLIPLVPFMLIPLAGPLDRWRSWRLWQRAAAVVGVLLSVALQAWLAVHSIFQILWIINHDYGRARYWAIADWKLWAMPPVQYAKLQAPALEFARAGNWEAARVAAQFEALGFGSWRLAAMTDADGLWHGLRATLVIGLLAGIALAGWFWLCRRAELQASVDVDAGPGGE